MLPSCSPTPDLQRFQNPPQLLRTGSSSALECRVTQNDTAGKDPVVETVFVDLHAHVHTLALVIRTRLVILELLICLEMQICGGAPAAALTYRTAIKDSCSQAGGRRPPLQAKGTVFSCISFSKSVLGNAFLSQIQHLVQKVDSKSTNKGIFHDKVNMR